MSRPTKSRPYLADPNYYRLGYQLAAQLLNERLAGRHETPPDDVAALARPASERDPAKVAATVRDDAETMLTWLRERPDSAPWWQPWQSPLEPHELRLKEFLEQTVAPCSRLVLAAALRPDDERHAAAVRDVEVVIQAAREHGVSYRTHYALACWHARDAAITDAMTQLITALELAPQDRRYDLAEWSVRDPALAVLRRDREQFLDRIEGYRRPKTVQPLTGEPLPQAVIRQLREGPSQTFAALPYALSLPAAANGDADANPIEAVLQTIGAFLNTEGGTLLIGAEQKGDGGRFADVNLNDVDTIGDWMLMGVDHELEHGWEQYVRDLQREIVQRIERDARAHVRIERRAARRQTLAVVTVGVGGDRFFVRPAREDAGADPAYWARVGAQNVRLAGTDVEDHVKRTTLEPERD